MWWYRLVLLLLLSVRRSSQTETFSLNSTFNLVKHLKSITASNTCGMEESELYCLLTGTPLAPGLDWSYSRYPGKYIDGQLCNMCEPDQHSIENAVDEDQDNWWQSSSLATISQFDQEMTIDLDFGQEYQAVYFILKAANSPRPARWVLEKSVDGGRTYTPWQIYVATDSDCQEYYNVTASHFPVNFLSDDQVICTSYYSTLDPLENGQIYTSLVLGRPGAELFYLNESPRLQQWMKATNVRLRLERMQVLHSLISEGDITANRRMFYSIREIIIAGRCSCNGHAAQCTKQEDASIQCDCEGNTCGATCDTCCHGYNLLPWQPSSSIQKFQCEECQCYGHSEGCHYDAELEGVSMDIGGEVRGGGVCDNCTDNTEGVNCEACIEGYYRGERETLYDDTCRDCACNTANIQLVTGLEFGSCDQSDGGQCYCKPEYGSRTCDKCRGDHYNELEVGMSCKACECSLDGTVSQLQNCEDVSGNCLCKEHVIGGTTCTTCIEETYNITLDNEYGCSACACNVGGSENNNCDKETGQCDCKSGLNSRQCNKVAPVHYIPATDFLALEAESGTMKGRDALYDFKEGVFEDGFHYRGYATLNAHVPTVDMEVEVPQYSRYKVRITYQLEDSFQTYTGYITAKPADGSKPEQKHAVTLETCTDGCDVTVQECTEEGDCEDVYLDLSAGDWIISFSYNAPAFNLDRVVLTPRLFDQPAVTQTDVSSCTLDNQALCNEYQLPNLEPNLHNTLDIEDHTATFDVEEPGSNSIIIDFLYNGTDIENLTLTISDGVVNKTGHFTLHHCVELQMCRAVIRDEDGRPLVYDSVPGKLSVNFDEEPTGPDPLVGNMHLVTYTDDLLYALKPQYICMRGTDARCTVNEYPAVYPMTARPAYKGRIVVESSTDGEPDTKIRIPDENIESRSNYPKLTEVCGNTDAVYEVKLILVGSPGLYRVILEYFYTGLDDLLVEVPFNDDKGIVGKGIAKFTPCNGYSACRTLVKNTDWISNFFLTAFFSLSSKNVIIQLLNIPVGKCLLLNEIITTASTLPSSSLITPLPLLRTEEFLESCTRDSTETFCEEAYLTVAAEYFNGLPECGCDPDGSLSEECEVKGGQCDCKENVIGRTCNHCKAGFFGFPDCQPCAIPRCLVTSSGFSGVCDERTGACECAPNVIGDRCDQCDADSHSYDALLGCKDCVCSMEGASGESCDEEGNCFCKEDSITGAKCDSCVVGNTNFPSCEPCGCEPAGSTGETCETETGQCPCKENVSGQLCDTCQAGYYNLEDTNERGCQVCFCFGVTDNCTSADMTYEKLGLEFEEGDTQGWVALESLSRELTYVPLVSESAVYPGLYELVIDSADVPAIFDSGAFLWLAPYTGDLTYSYEGQLEFTMGYFPVDPEEPADMLRVEIQGTHGSLYHDDEGPSPAGYTPYSIALIEGQWYEAENDTLATPDQIMSTLVDVSSITITGDLATVATYTLLSVSLDSAGPASNGIGHISHIEQCACPEGYGGTSCQLCTDSYYRSSNSTSLLGDCVPCECNGHSDTCDVDTGVCRNCSDNTLGDNCELCVDGHYGDPREGRTCQLCPCPLPLEGNVFGTCEYASTQGSVLTCDCEEGYEGGDCGECSPGYHGYPRLAGGSCVECSTCSNNTDTAQDYCDSETGDCTLCLFNTTGDQCQECSEGHHGDALMAEDCQPCMCDVSGSRDLICDSSSGECDCLPNVNGDNCDTCDSGHWNLTQDVGCTACECNDNGTQAGQCDQESGQCLCYDTVDGYECDQCKDEFYGLSNLGHCVECDCNEFGAITTVCDKESGQCICSSATAGQQCDICDNWAIMISTGCMECAGCSKILKDYMDELSAGVSTAIQLKERGGRISEDIEDLIELKNTALLTKKTALENMERVQIDEGRLGITAPLPSDSVRYNYNKLDDFLQDKILNKLEEVDDATRGKEDGIEVITSRTTQQNTTFHDIQDQLKQSTDIIANIQISSDDPEDVAAAIETSDMLIFDMESVEIYVVEQGLIDEMGTLNSTVFGTFSTLLDTDLVNINSEISRLSDGMDSVLENTVGSILSPIDGFNTQASGITGDLSNSAGTFNSKRRALDAKVVNLDTDLAKQTSDEELIADQMASNAAFLDTNFGDSADANLTQIVEEVLLSNQAFLDSTSTAVEEDIPPTCANLTAFHQKEVQVAGILENMNSFSEDMDLLRAAASVSSTIADEVESAVAEWSKDAVDMRVQNRNAISLVYLELSTSYTSLASKVATEGIEDKTSESGDVNQELRERLDAVTSQLAHDQTKRYISRLSVDQFEPSADAIAETVIKLEQDSEAAKKLINVGASEDSVEELQELHTENNENYARIKTLFEDGSPDSLSYKIELIKSKPAVSLSDRMKSLEEKMALIKQKVEETRQLAASVQVGVKMTEPSFISLPMPSVTEHSSRYTGISMMVKTTEPSGTLVYLGSSTSSDMFQLKLVERNVQLEFDIGDGRTTVTTDVNVADDNWHTIRAARNGKFGYVSIDSGSGNIKSFSGVNSGSLDILELDSDGYLLLGASKSTINSTDPDDRYKGSIAQLRISNTLIGLWGYKEEGGNLAPTQGVARYSSFAKPSRNGLCLQGWGYASYSGNGMSFQSGQTTVIRFKFNTFDKEGLILQLLNTDTSESISLRLTEGKLGIDLMRDDSLVTTGRTDGFVSTGEIVDVTLEIVSTSALVLRHAMKNGNEYTVAVPLEMGLEWSSEDAKIINVGGAENTDYRSLSGVVRSIFINDIRLSIQQQDALAYTGIANTCLPSKALDGITFYGYGYVRYNPIAFGRQFRLDVKIRTSQPYGVVMFASDALGFNAISLSVDNGLVEFVAMSNYAKTAVRAGSGVSDGEWHDISIVRDDARITLNVDGVTSATNIREDVLYPTTHGLYLGGIPPYSLPLLLDVVPNILPFEGAIRTLVVDEETIDLNNFVSAEGANFAGTSVKPSIKTYHTIG